MSKTLHLTKVFKTDINSLFDLWTQAEHLKAWHRPHATLFKTTDAAVDLKVGGKFMIVMEGPDGRHAVGGEFTEIDRPHSVAYTWQWEGSEEVSRVHLTFKTVDDGTELTLIHEHPEDSTTAEAHKEGWEGSFMVLEQLLNNKE